MPRRSRENPGFAAYGRNYRNDSIPPQAVSSKNFRYVYDEFRGPIVSQALGGGAAAGTTGATNQILTNCHFPYAIESFILGAGQTIITPTLVAANAGLLVSLDQVNDEGVDFVFGAPQAGTTAGKLAFQARVDKAFFVRLKFSIADASGTDQLYFGWKKATAANATFATGATDFACLSIIASAASAAINTSTLLNAGSQTDTDTGATWADAATKTWEVAVDADGYATMKNNDVIVGEKNFRFDDGDWLVPTWRYLNHSDVAGDIVFKTFECGFQSR